MPNTEQQLKQRLADLCDKATAIHEKAMSEGRDYTPEESRDVDGWLNTFDAVAADLERVHRLVATRLRINEPPSLRERTQYIDHGTTY